MVRSKTNRLKNIKIEKKNKKSTKKRIKNSLKFVHIKKFYDSWRVTCSYRGVAQFLGIW